MNYPNFTAEFEAAGYRLKEMSGIVGVGEDQLLDVLYGQGDLPISGFIAAHNAFNASVLNDVPCRCTTDYLLAPALGTLDPRKPKNRYRLHILRSLLQSLAEARGSPAEGMLSAAEKVCEKMSREERVLYAAYRNVMKDLTLLSLITGLNIEALERLITSLEHMDRADDA